VYETYINSLAPGERPIPLNVAQESHALRLITMVVDNREEVEGIIDPGSQIIAMSEAVCHDIGLAYNLSIKLNMQSANGEVDQSLGLAHNIPCKINTITLYLQIHII
jgi:predicted aspartyl protease